MTIVAAKDVRIYMQSGDEWQELGTGSVEFDVQWEAAFTWETKRLSYAGWLELVPHVAEYMYRHYVAWYNMSHPNQKLSWRRLNRPQREAAARMYMQEVFVDRLRTIRKAPRRKLFGRNSK